MVSKTEFRKSFKALLSAPKQTEGANAEKFVRAQAQLNERIEEFFADLFYVGARGPDSGAALGANSATPRADQSSGQGTQLWAAFQPCDHEPNIRPALARIEAMLGGLIAWVYPRVNGDDLEFYRVADESGFAVSPGWHIREPDPKRATRVQLKDIHGFLTPGLVFDRRLSRMGRGRGYYDRVFTHIHSATNATLDKPYKLGIALDRQISKDEIPVDPFDIPMDAVLTETQFFGRMPWEKNGQEFQPERTSKWTRS